MDEGTTSAPSAWSASSGVMVQSSNIYSFPADAASLPKLGTYAQYDAGVLWTDYRVSLTLRSTDDDALGVMFRVQGSNDYYRLCWDRERAYRRLVKNVGGVFSVLAEDSVTYVTGQTYAVEITAQGTSIEVRVDGGLVFSVTDGDLSSGTVALYSWGNSGSHFDDVVVENLVDQPPAITSVGSTTGIVGVSYLYDADGTVEATGTAPVTFLVSGPTGMAVNDTTGLVTWTPTAGQEGNHAVQIDALNAFGVDLQNFTINVASSLLLSDDFSDGDFAGWSVVDEGTTSAPSAWSASSGVMVQSSNIYSFPTDAASLPKLGTYAQYDAGVLWTDYRVSLTLRSTDDDALGVMFRVQGSNDYYRLSWDRQRAYRRLVKNVGGVFSVLAEDSVTYVTGQTYAVEITAQGTSIEVRVDGGLVFSVTDGDLSSGTIALYSWATAQSHFDDVLVEELTIGQAPSITSVASTAAVAGVAYSYDADDTVEASGTAPITFALSVGPPGMTVSGTGLVTWTPTAAEEGSNQVQIDAVNAVNTASQSFTIEVAVAPSITSVASTTAVAGVAYSYDADDTVEASGTAPITFSLSIGPPGMTVSGTGLVTWTPTAAEEGSNQVQIDAVNAVTTASQSFTIEVAVAPSITSVASTAAVAGVAYSYDADDTVEASGTAPITFALSVGPPGMTVSGTGLVTWTPTAAEEGSNQVQIDAVNAVTTASQSFTIEVAVAPSITSVASTTAVAGVAYSYDADDTVEASGTAPITFSLSIGPAGMTVSTAGLVTWTPTAAEEGSNQVQIDAVNAVNTASQSFTIEVAVAPSITSVASTTAVAGVAYSYDADDTVEASGTAPITFALSIGPAGMTVSTAGLVTWTPTAAEEGSNQVQIDAVNAVNTASQSFTIEVAVAPSITSVASTAAVAGVAYSYDADDTVEASGTAPITFALSVGPPGMTVSGTGLVTWTPTAAEEGSNQVQIDAVNAVNTASQSFTIEVAVAPSITSVASTTAVAGVAYSYDADDTVEASGTAPITFSLSIGPAGMTVSTAGLVTWTPTAAEEGSNQVQIDAVNAVNTASQSFTIEVAVAPSITSVASTAAVAGVAYAYDADDTVEASGTAPITFALADGPPGMTVSGAGLVMWTPTAAQEGSHQVEIEAVNAVDTDSQSFAINVASSLLLSDDFGDGNFTDWSVVDEGTTSAPSAWSAGSGVMVQSSNIYSLPADAASLPKLGTYAQYDAGVLWTDYRVSLTLRSTDDDALGVMFRVQGSNDYYRLCWDRERAYRRLVKNVGGVFSVLAEDSVTYVTGQTYAVEITAQGTSIEVRVDGGLVFSVTDGDLSSGTVALYSWGNSGSHFDDVVVENLVDQPPAITSVGSTTGIVGVSYLYDADGTVEATGTAPVTFLVSGPTGMAVNDTTGLVTWTPTAGQEGNHAVQIDALNAFGVDLQNFTINVASSLLLSDDFSDGDFAGWSVVDEGTTSAPSAWSASSGVMVQSSNIYSFPTDAASLPKLGTYAQYDAGVLWTDYRVSLTLRSTDDDALGVMFRVQGSNDYYRLSWDRQRAYRRLVKNVGGVFSVLAEDSVTYVTGQTYAVEITAQGTSIEVRVDGGLVFSVTDGDLSSGTIALYSWGNSGSHFDGILVGGL